MMTSKQLTLEEIKQSCEPGAFYYNELKETAERVAVKAKNKGAITTHIEEQKYRFVIYVDGNYFAEVRPKLSQKVKKVFKGLVRGGLN